MGKQMRASLFWTLYLCWSCMALPQLTVSGGQGRLANQAQSESPLHQSLKLLAAAKLPELYQCSPGQEGASCMAGAAADKRGCSCSLLQGGLSQP